MWSLVSELYADVVRLMCDRYFLPYGSSLSQLCSYMDTSNDKWFVSLVLSGDVRSVSYWLPTWKVSHSPGDNPYYMLTASIVPSHIDMFKYVLRECYDDDDPITNSWYTDSLVDASELIGASGDDSLVTLFLDYYLTYNHIFVDVEVTIYDSVMFGAARGGHEHTIQDMVDQGARAYGDAMVTAGCHTNVVKMLMKLMSDSNQECPQYALYETCVSACCHGNAEVVEYMIECGLELGENGYPALARYAAEHGKIDVIKLLARNYGVDFYGPLIQKVTSTSSMTSNNIIVVACIIRDVISGWYGLNACHNLDEKEELIRRAMVILSSCSRDVIKEHVVDRIIDHTLRQRMLALGDTIPG
jgi:hypothetical protein